MNDEFMKDTQANDIPNGKSFEEKTYTMSKPPVSQSVHNQTYIPPVQSVPNQTNIPPVHSIPNQMNRPPVQSLPNQTNIPPVQSIPNQMNIPPVQSIPNQTNIPPVQSTPNQMYRPPVQNMPNQMNIPPVQNMPNQMYRPPVQGGYYQRPPQYPMQPAYSGVPNGYRYYQPSPEEKEKDELHKSFSFSGKTTLILLGSLYLVSIIIMIIGFFSGIITDTPTLGDPYSGLTPIGFYAYEGLASLLGLFIPSLILAKSTKISMNELFPFKKLEGKYLAALVFGGMAVCMIAQLAVSLLISNMYIFGIDLESALDQETASGVADIVLSTVCTAVIPALVEEFAFRGVVLGVLKKHDEMFAIFASAFLFGLLHGNFVQIPFAFIVGLVAAFVRVKSDSMLPSILLHFGNNFFAVLMTAASDLLPDTINSLVESGVMFVLIIGGIFAINYLVKNHKDIFEQKKPTTRFSFAELNKQFLSTGTIIACMILLVLSSIVLVSVVQ